MLDFLMISTRSTKRGTLEIYPKFIINNKSSDLMIRGSDFYAIWVEERGLWSTDEQDALQLIDRELDKYSAENKGKIDGQVKVLHMWDAETGLIDQWHKYCQKQMRDNYHMLDEKLIFSNTETKKKDYSSKRLSYPLEPGDMPAYDKLISTLYSDEERRKIEWAIGSVVNGDSKKIQKFVVFYGAAGTGKSTILNIIQKLFEGYYSVFDAKALGSSNNAFALEAFKSNPLVAIQHDGDLSRIEDNTRLNSLVSHEMMTVNEKFKSTYANRFKSFLFMGTNKPVKITDAKSGLIRRLIDVSPSGNKLSPQDYKNAVKQIDFELGAIAFHCQKVYLEDPGRYDDYIPTSMLGASNDFYNYVLDSYCTFKNEDGVTLKAAWEMYKNYCDEAKVQFPFSQRIFKEELKNYFWDYSDRLSLDDGTRLRSYYSKFRTDKFEEVLDDVNEKKENTSCLIDFGDNDSIFDKDYADCPAQYANSKEIPTFKWNDSKVSKLRDIDTRKLHYVKVPENLIVIDFDIPDENGNKCFEKNLEEASKWPPTYAELSKSGKGIHLHYIYTGDPSKLSRVYDEHIEVKVFTGNSSLRRKLTKCNNIPISTISSGLRLLPSKGEKMVNFDAVQSEKSLRTQIKRNLNKEIHPYTKPSVDFIYKILDDAYKSGIKYDVTDMRNSILAFAASSTHQADSCIQTVNKMQFKSEEPSPALVSNSDQLVFFDVEVFSNLFLINWKFRGKGKKIVHMINPSSIEIEQFLKLTLVGFNNRRYDNHIVYAGLIGYTNEQIYNLSQKIINGSTNCFFSEAFNISYTDIFDFSSKKQSLKKFEIDLGIHHHELGLPWDKPVPKELWPKVADYCDDDVLAAEAVFDDRESDFVARQILADVAGMTVNDTTNSLTTKIIFGNNRKPQSQFNYRNLSQPVTHLDPETYNFLKEAAPEMMAQKHGPAQSLLPYFPGYEFDHGKSTYRGDIVSEGGRVYAEPGMYLDVALLDIASMHPSSVVDEVLFGVEYTKRFEELKNSRVYIKHEYYEAAKKVLEGKLKPYLENGKYTSSQLSGALKIGINSVYGLTDAGFVNCFRDPRNIDNIVAKRGALFMTDLKFAVQEQGFTVAHIKTDSIKIPNATPAIIKFVQDFGKKYGYTFEHEATYERMCLVNDAVYIAKYATVEHCCDLYGTEYVNSQKDIVKDNKKHPDEWTATGTQFQVPYVFKTLFTKESITFNDLCETKSVKTSIYLDMNENLPDVSGFEKKYQDLDKKYRDSNGLYPMDITMEMEDLKKEIEKGHNYVFIGKVGLFCPIKPNCGGGVLVSERDGKYNAVTGTKGYRWLESEMVKELGKETDIDRAYYDGLVNGAVESMSKYGDTERFMSNDPCSVLPFTMDGIPESSDFVDAIEAEEKERSAFAVR